MSYRYRLPSLSLPSAAGFSKDVFAAFNDLSRVIFHLASRSCYVLFSGGMLLTVLAAVPTLARAQQQRKQTAFRERSLQNLKFALDQHAIVSITNSDRTIIYANKKFLDIMEYTVQQLLGKNRDLINSDVHDQKFTGEIWISVKKRPRLAGRNL